MADKPIYYGGKSGTPIYYGSKKPMYYGTGQAYGGSSSCTIVGL